MTVEYLDLDTRGIHVAEHLTDLGVTAAYTSNDQTNAVWSAALVLIVMLFAAGARSRDLGVVRRAVEPRERRRLGYRDDYLAAFAFFFSFFCFGVSFGLLS